MSKRAFSETYDESTDEKRDMGSEAERLVADEIGGYIEPTDGNGYDGGIDVVGPNGTLIDVKSISDPTYRLIVRTERKQYSNAEVYVLVYDGEILGALSADEMYSREPETLWYPKPANDVHAAEQSELRDISEYIN